MKYTTCVSIAHESPDTILSKLDKALKLSRYVELRLDYIKHDKIEPLLDMANKYLDRAVCTLRPKREGGLYRGTESERIRMLKVISEYKPYLLDVEYSTVTQNNLSDDISCNTMVSWHDFGGTPTLDKLISQMNAMAKYSDTVKIATLANSSADAAKILALYAYAEKHSLVAFAMGDIGRYTRLCAIHMGSPFMYVYVDKAVAPGQYSIHEIQRIQKEGIL